MSTIHRDNSEKNKTTEKVTDFFPAFLFFWILSFYGQNLCLRLLSIVWYHYLVENIIYLHLPIRRKYTWILFYYVFCFVNFSGWNERLPWDTCVPLQKGKPEVVTDYNLQLISRVSLFKISCIFTVQTFRGDFIVFIYCWGCKACLCQFSPPVTWLLAIKYRSSSLAVITLTC